MKRKAPDLKDLPEAEREKKMKEAQDKEALEQQRAMRRDKKAKAEHDEAIKHELK